MLRSVGTLVDIAAALQPNDAVCAVPMVPFQLTFVAVAWFPACSVMVASQLRISVVGVVNVQRSVHPLIAGPLFVMSTSAENPPVQELITVYVHVTAVCAVAGRAMAAIGISVASAIRQARKRANRINLLPMAALYIRTRIRTRK